MSETTTQITARIEEAREELGANLEELERKVKTAVDWKEQVKSHPAAMVGLAFGTGLILAMLTRGGRRPKAC